VAWWGWLLVAWVLLAAVAAVVLGRLIRTAERRDRSEDRIGDAPDDGDPWAG
jgi:hypothetical protein